MLFRKAVWRLAFQPSSMCLKYSRSLIPVVVEVPAQRHAPAFVRHGHSGRAGREGEVEITGPGAGQHVDVDVVGHIDEPADEDQVAALHALAPVQIGQTRSLVAERRQEQADVAGFEAQAAGGHVAAKGMAVFHLPDQGAGVALAVGGRLPAAEQAVHAAEGVIGTGRFAGLEVGDGVVTAQADAVLFFDFVLPIEIAAGEIARKQRRDLVGIDVQAVFDLLRTRESADRPGLARRFRRFARRRFALAVGLRLFK
jgi:hypothetical protein